MSEIEGFNKFMVGVSCEQVFIGSPPRGPMTPDDALLLAAYLVSMAEVYTDREFKDVLSHIQE